MGIWGQEHSQDTGPSLPTFLVPDFALASNRGVPGTRSQPRYPVRAQPSLPWALAGFLPAHCFCLLQRVGCGPWGLLPRSHWVPPISFLGSWLYRSLPFPALVLLLMPPTLGLSPDLRACPPPGHMCSLPPRHLSCPSLILPSHRQTLYQVCDLSPGPSPTFSPLSPIVQACLMGSCEVRSQGQRGIGAS